MDLLRGKPGAWLAPEITAEALAETMIAALEAVQPGDRFCHACFPSSGDLAKQTVGPRTEVAAG